ncbi:MAG: hypothetical protein AEth_01325 [Candidatus Argoarchaeum ethanivorans]|uniref:Uncharacterized protein n=1 Tax=Candidatus Argoarchaeum ethanivorans TaxID=2608793 RepID=A0A8B3S111_9EURY|nr:MAG: hypothetical protein AEth_01325 [Candidatus Argoarchaeum ethanivorans]
MTWVGIKMLDKVQVMAISPKILTLKDAEIFTYFRDKNVNHIKSDEWIFFDDVTGINIKISKTGIAETTRIFEEMNVKDRLFELANTTQNIASELFRTNAIYDVFIYQNLNTNLEISKKVSKYGEKIESLSFTFKNNIYVDVKIGTLGYWIIMKGISDVEDIITIYDAILNDNGKSLRKSGCKDFKAVVSLT